MFHTVFLPYHTLYLDASTYLINVMYVADFTHEGRGEQAPQSKTGQLLIITMGYVTPAPLGGSSIKD